MIDTAGVLCLRCPGGNRAVVRGGNPCLTRGLGSTLESHKKSLGHYTEGKSASPRPISIHEPQLPGLEQ